MLKLLKGNLLAAMLSSVIVGLGQIVKGDSGKGLNLLLLFYFIIPVVLAALLYINGGLFLVAFGFSLIFSCMIWGYNILDAYKASTKAPSRMTRQKKDNFHEKIVQDI
ncbi:MAG: hypothetical protein ABIJ26_08235 [Candidatus Margulisiibacteriota bacterium]|nr:hypothetical protein [Candidatus Margulisiibacteriota bacterium]